MPSSRRYEKNYNCIMKIMNVAVCEGLREIFKQEWDKQHGATEGVWDDTCISGNEFYNMEKTRHHAKPYLNDYRLGKRSEWDCTTLVDAILYSNALNVHLAPHVSNKVDELRNLRNILVHKFSSKHAMPDAAFDNAYKKITKCFEVLKLPTGNVQRISKERHFTWCWKTPYSTATIFLIVIIVGLLPIICYPWKATSLFKVLPPRPVHMVATRDRTVNSILEDLRNLSVRNKRSLTYFYISGNPGSSISQLARLVGQRYGSHINSYSWWSARSTFVMTLNGRSLHDILISYVYVARRLCCGDGITEAILNSNKTSAEAKVKSLLTEIAKILNKKVNSRHTWLFVVDNVVNLTEISPFLPSIEDENWKGGQVLIAVRNSSFVPSNSSLVAHISASHGMDPAKSSEFLTAYSGFNHYQSLVEKTAKELDYELLELSSFYIKQVRESKSCRQFTLKCNLLVRCKSC